MPFLVRFRGGKNSKILNLGTIKRVHFNFLEFEFGCFFLNSHLRILATGSRQNNKSCIIFSRKKKTVSSRFNPALKYLLSFAVFLVILFQPRYLFVFFAEDQFREQNLKTFDRRKHRKKQQQSF